MLSLPEDFSEDRFSLVYSVTTSQISQETTTGSGYTRKSSADAIRVSARMAQSLGLQVRLVALRWAFRHKVG